MNKREPLLSEEYFDESIAEESSILKQRETALVAYPPQVENLDLLAFFVFNHRRGLLAAEYSRGYPLNQLRTDFPAIIDAWERLRAIDVESAYPSAFKDNIDYYVQGLGLLSQAYLLGMDQAVLLRLVACIGNEGQDLLFERLVAQLLPELVRKPAKKLLYPKAYQPVYDALEASTDEQVVLMQQFLKEWYKRMRSASWYDAHKGRDGGGFVGYWCWEAAGIALAFGIDDSSFRELPYYPKDMADFARAAT